MTWPPKNCNRLNPLLHDFSQYIHKIQGSPCSPHSLPALVGSHFFWHPSTWCRTSDRRSKMDLLMETIQGHQLVKLKQLEMMVSRNWWLYVLWYVSTENWVSSNQNINEVHNQLELNADKRSRAAGHRIVLHPGSCETSQSQQWWLSWVFPGAPEGGSRMPDAPKYALRESLLR